MSLSLFLDVAAALSGLYSGIFFCVGTLHVKNSALESLAVTYWTKGAIMATQLAEQKVDFLFGAGWLIASFFLQLLAEVWPSVDLIIVASSLHIGLALSLSLPTVIVFLTYFSWRRLRKRGADRIATIVKEKG